MPGSPLPDERIRIPWSIPAGALTSSVLLRLIRPVPLAWVQDQNHLASAMALRTGL